MRVRTASAKVQSRPTQQQTRQRMGLRIADRAKPTYRTLLGPRTAHRATAAQLTAIWPDAGSCSKSGRAEPSLPEGRSLCTKCRRTKHPEINKRDAVQPVSVHEASRGRWAGDTPARKGRAPEDSQMLVVVRAVLARPQHCMTFTWQTSTGTQRDRGNGGISACLLKSLFASQSDPSGSPAAACVSTGH